MTEQSLVERLREYAEDMAHRGYDVSPLLMEEAADHITSLSARLEKAEGVQEAQDKQHFDLIGKYRDLLRKNAALTAQLAETDAALRPFAAMYDKIAANPAMMADPSAWVDAPAMDALIAAKAALSPGAEDKVGKVRKILRKISQGAENQNISHVDFRVNARHAADAALTALDGGSGAR